MSIPVDFMLLVSGIAALFLCNEPLITCEYNAGRKSELVRIAMGKKAYCSGMK